MNQDMRSHLEKCAKIKRHFEFHGASVADWARAHGFAPKAVYAVLQGRNLGKRGEAYRVAVALGLRKGVTA